MPDSTLSTHGALLAAAPSARDTDDALYTPHWDPDTNPDGIVNIGSAENHLILDDMAAFFATKKIVLQGVDLDYGEGPWGSLRLRTVISNFINTNFHPLPPTSPSTLTLTNGATSLLSTLALVLANPHDAILLPNPTYVGFASDVRLLARLHPIYIPFGPHDQFSDAPDSVLRAYEAALSNAAAVGQKVKMLILTNPHNPLGRCYTPDMLAGIMRFCQRYGIHLVVDEVYAMSVYDDGGVPFTSVLSLAGQGHIDADLLHHVYGLSKDFALGGLRVGVLHTRNAGVQRAVSALAPFYYSGSVSAKLACMVLEDVEFCEEMLGKSRVRLAAAARLAKGLLEERGIRWKEGVNAGFFLWVDLRPWLRGADAWEGERELSCRLEKERVYLLGGQVHGAEEAGWFRFVFTRKEAIVREGVKRLVRALGERNQE